MCSPQVRNNSSVEARALRTCCWTLLDLGDWVTWSWLDLVQFVLTYRKYLTNLLVCARRKLFGGSFNWPYIKQLKRGHLLLHSPPLPNSGCVCSSRHRLCTHTGWRVCGVTGEGCWFPAVPYCGIKVSPGCLVLHFNVNVGVWQIHVSVLETEVWHTHDTAGLFQVSHSEGSAASAIPLVSHKLRLTSSLSSVPVLTSIFKMQLKLVNECDCILICHRKKKNQSS